jgi:hypothetical protein
MNDTSSEMDQRNRALLMQRTGQERLIMGCAMRDTARAFVEASLRAQDPQTTIESLRKGLFLRFYGQEFDAERRARILAAIESSARLWPSNSSHSSESQSLQGAGIHPLIG